MSDKATFSLHGFSFPTRHRRNKAATGHHLWPEFVKYFRRCWSPNGPNINTSDDRLLFEFYIEGAYRESVFKSDADNAPLRTVEQDADGVSVRSDSFP